VPNSKHMNASKILVIVLAILQITSCSESPNQGAKRGSQSQSNDQTPSDDGDLIKQNSTCPKFPMVFLHGFMAGNRVGNFAGVKKHFEAKGCKVLVVEVSPVNSIEFRGQQLADQVKNFMGRDSVSKVNIVAHSQGGLDARYAVSKLGLGTNVASLSMLSTPNHGTPVADVALGLTGDSISQLALGFLLNMMSSVSNSSPGSSNDSRKAIEGLTTTYLKEKFNPTTPDVPGVLYQSWGARSGRGTNDQTKLLLDFSWGLIKVRAGENDGVVPVSSAQWGDYKGTLDADHLDLVGLKLEDAARSKFDHLGFLDTLSAELMAKGY